MNHQVSILGYLGAKTSQVWQPAETEGEGPARPGRPECLMLEDIQVIWIYMDLYGLVWQ